MPGGGHLDLMVGEMALTFDTPTTLTYYKGKDQEEVVEMEGVVAMAVSAYPQFKIRTCSTFHWAKPEYEAMATKYVILHEQIDKLVAKGIRELTQIMGQTMAQGQGPSSSSGMTRSQEVQQPLIDLENP